MLSRQSLSTHLDCHQVAQSAVGKEQGGVSESMRLAAARRLSMLAASVVDHQAVFTPKSRSVTTFSNCTPRARNQGNCNHSEVQTGPLKVALCSSPAKFQNARSTDSLKSGLWNQGHSSAGRSEPWVRTFAAASSVSSGKMAHQERPIARPDADELDITYLTQEQAVAIDEELMGPLGFSVDQLMVRCYLLPGL